MPEPAYISTKQIGDITVTLVDEGSGPYPIELNVDEPTWRPDVPEADSHGNIHMHMGGAIIRTPTALVVVDPGMDFKGSPVSERVISEAMPGWELTPGFAGAFDYLGLDPMAVTHVLITHAHFDHCLGILEHDQDEPHEHRARYRRARHILGSADWDMAVNEAGEAIPAEGGRFGVVTTYMRRRLAHIGSRALVEPVDLDVPITDGVEFIAAPGESPGHFVVRVESQGQVAWLLGDLVHYAVEFQHPEWISPNRNVDDMLASREKIFPRLVDENAQVQWAHARGWGRIIRTDTGYAWQPEIIEPENQEHPTMDAPQPPREIANTDAYYHVVLERIPPRPEPAFEDASMQERVWGRQWGVGDDVGQLQLVALHRPGEEMKTIDPDKYDESIEALIDDREQWYWRDAQGPDIPLMQRQHDGLRQALLGEGVELVDVGGSAGDVKAIFTRDQAIAVDGGAIICRMGPVGADKGFGRRGEESYITQLIASLGMPILRTIHGTGLIEGGSFCFLKPGVAALGMSFRQNEEGARQLEDVLGVTGTRLIRIPLTGHALHLDGAIVMVDHDKALVNVTRLPYWMLDELKALGIEIIHVWPTEGHAVNSLAVRPGRILISEGCPRTVERLNERGVETIVVDYSEVRKNGGGIHCSTLPLIRARP